MACKFRALMPTRRCPLPGRTALAAALALAAGAGPALAEKADRSKPMNVEADVGRYDDVKQVGVFSGNVVVTKGTIQLRAGQIEVRQTPEGYQSGVATATPGKLASFRQKRDGVDETIEGQADRIEYDSRSDTVRFVGHAVVRRLRDGKVADETTGSLITYDNAAEVFSVAGGTAASSPGNPSGRVRAVLTPRDAPASAPRPGGASTPALRLSPSLGESR
jgi:lipopolysaccharide export system protein LptA